MRHLFCRSLPGSHSKLPGYPRSRMPLQAESPSNLQIASCPYRNLTQHLIFVFYPYVSSCGLDLCRVGRNHSWVRSNGSHCAWKTPGVNLVTYLFETLGNHMPLVCILRSQRRLETRAAPDYIRTVVCKVGDKLRLILGISADQGRRSS